MLLLLCSHKFLSDSFATPRTVACQASWSMGFPRQEYWRGLRFPPPGNLANPEIEPTWLALAEGFFTTESPGKPNRNFTALHVCICINTGNRDPDHEAQCFHYSRRLLPLSSVLVKPPYYPRPRARTCAHTHPHTHTHNCYSNFSLSWSVLSVVKFCNTVPHIGGTLLQLASSTQLPVIFIHVAAWGSRWNALTAVKYLIYNSTTFIHSVADGNLGCFHFGLF